VTGSENDLEALSLSTKRLHGFKPNTLLARVHTPKDHNAGRIVNSGKELASKVVTSIPLTHLRS
jgi:hypothetical protein